MPATVSGGLHGSTMTVKGITSKICHRIIQILLLGTTLFGLAQWQNKRRRYYQQNLPSDHIYIEPAASKTDHKSDLY